MVNTFGHRCGSGLNPFEFIEDSLVSSTTLEQKYANICAFKTVNMLIYFILSSEINVYQKWIKVIFSLRTRENFDVFNSLDEIYLVFTSKK